MPGAVRSASSIPGVLDEQMKLNRSFANRGRDTLDAAATHVAYRKDSRQTGFKQVRRTGKGPACRAQIFWRQIRSRLNEAFNIERDTAIEPTGVRIGSRHDEHVADIVLLDLPSLIVSPANGFEVIASFERHDLGVREQYDRRGLFDPANKISGHALSQTGRPYEHVHTLCCLRQKHGSLACRVSSANHNEFFSATRLRFHKGRAVIHAGAFKARQVF